MVIPSISAVSRVRSASRQMVRELGLMNKTLFGDALSISAIHALIEIDTLQPLTAQDLTERLILEKSTVSRLIKSLVSHGDVTQSASALDRRQMFLSLTEQGSNTVQRIHSAAEGRVRRALQRTSKATQDEITAGLQAYAEALYADRLSLPMPNLHNSMTVISGYKPGLLGTVVSLHTKFYGNAHGFGAVFETKVAGGLADFVPRLENLTNQIWHAAIDDRIIGSISVDGQDLASYSNEPIGHIRWFIVDDDFQGIGVGSALMKAAMAFCEKAAFREIHLWTFEGLEAARVLYERDGFVVTEEKEGTTWGKPVMEQKFVRKLSPPQ